MAATRSAVIVEDDAMNAEYFRILCTEFGLQVVGMAANAENAIEMIRNGRPEIVIMDVRLEGEKDGIDLSFEVHEEIPDVRIVYVTGSTEPATIDRIKTDHPHRILLKPIDRDQLLEAVR